MGGSKRQPADPSRYAWREGDVLIKHTGPQGAGGGVWAGSGEILKAEESDDGKTLRIEGLASHPSRDADGEVVTTEAMRAAIGPFLSTGPALREMHQLVAAGRVTDAWIDSDGATRIRAIVVDEGSVRKVKAGVLTQLSIGGSVTRRASNDASVVTGITLREVSLVDRGAQPRAILTSIKAALAAKLAAAGEAAPAVEPDPLAQLAIEDGGREEAVERAAPLAPDLIEKLAVTTTALAKAEAARDRAIAQAAEAMAQRDRLEKAARARIAKVETFAKRLDQERADLVAKLSWAEGELARRSKGSLKAIPVEKADDTGGPPREPQPEPEDARSLIKAAQRRPILGGRR